MSSILRMFKKNVEKYLEDYRADLSYHEEKYWRTKVLITERAVISRRHKREIKAVKNMFDGIKEELESLKKIVDAKDENIAEKVSQVIKVKVHEVNDLKVDKNMFDDIKDELEKLKKVVHAKGENASEEVSEVIITKKAVGSRKHKKKIKAKKDEIVAPTVKEMFDEIKSVNVKNENIAKKESKVKKVKVNEGNDLKVDKIVFDELKEELESLKTFNKKLFDEVNDLKRNKNDDESSSNSSAESERKKKKKKKNKNRDRSSESTGSSDSEGEKKRKKASKAASMEEMIEESMVGMTEEETGRGVEAVAGACNDDEAGMGMNPFNLVPLLHTIVAMLLISGRTLHEQRLLVAKVSKYSRSSRYSSPQSEVSPSSSSPCSCQIQSRLCCEVTTTLLDKVSFMANTTRTGVTWLSQTWLAAKCVKEEIMRKLAHFLVNKVIGLDRVMITIEDDLK